MTICIENVARLSNQYFDRSRIGLNCDRFDKTPKYDFFSSNKSYQNVGPSMFYRSQTLKLKFKFSLKKISIIFVFQY